MNGRNQAKPSLRIDAVGDRLTVLADGGFVIAWRTQTQDANWSYGVAMRRYDAAGVPVRVVPGVSSAMASAAAAVESFTLPEVTQTVIFTRVEGRTPMPEGESLTELAQHHCTLCIFLSITLLHKVEAGLRAAGWADDAPMLVVHKASWPGEELIVRGTLADIAGRLGFSEASTFHRAFKGWTGLTPGAYRQAHNEPTEADS